MAMQFSDRAGGKGTWAGARAVGALGGFVLLSLGSPATAADAAPGAVAPQNAEVVVTARKQSESLQKVPLTVTAVGGAELARFAYDKPEDVTSRIPALNVSCCGSGSGAQVSLRGVGSSSISAAFDSAVALDFDGVVVSSMRVLQSGFFDVRQVEVLKGPQSLYFGKSASAGVLSFKSADPTAHWESGAKASYDFEQQGYSAEAYTSGPIADNLGLRLAAKYNRIDDVVHNSAPGVVHPDRGETNANVRATLQWQPFSGFTANLKFNYVHHDADGSIRNTVVGCGKNGVADPISLAGGAVNIPAGYSCDTSGNHYFLPDVAPPLAAQAPLGKDDNHGVPFTNSDIFFGRLKLDWKLNSDLTLSSVTGFLNQDSAELDAFSYGGELNGASFGTGAGLAYNKLRQFSQELRLTSTFEGPLNFMAGAFYETRRIDFDTAQNGINIAVFAGPDPVTGNTFDWYKQHLTNTDAVSAFGSVNYDITSQLKLAGGIRFTREVKDQRISIPYENAILSGAFGFAPSGFVADPIHFSDSNLSPEVSLSYQPTRDLNFYGAYKTGFKSGGIDNSALPSNALLGLSSPDPAVKAATAASLKYKSETAEGGEIGVKSQWFDRTLTLNASLYDYTFKNLQLQIFDGVAIQFRTTNAGKLTSRGADLDFRWLSPIQGLSFYGALAYTDSTYTETYIPNPVSGEDLKGRASSGAPKWAGNIAASYHAPVGAGFAFDLTGNLQFKSSYYTNDASRTDYLQEASALFDLAGSIGPEDGRWAVAMIATNLADKRLVTSSGPRPFLPANGDDVVLNLGEGRKVFVQVSVKF